MVLARHLPCCREMCVGTLLMYWKISCACVTTYCFICWHALFSRSCLFLMNGKKIKSKIEVVGRLLSGNSFREIGMSSQRGCLREGRRMHHCFIHHYEGWLEFQLSCYTCSHSAIFSLHFVLCSMQSVRLSLSANSIIIWKP